MRQQLLSELQMLTGVVTNDISYLVYLLLKDGSYFESPEIHKFVKSEIPIFEHKVPGFEDWFKSLEEETGNE